MKCLKCNMFINIYERIFFHFFKNLFFPDFIKIWNVLACCRMTCNNISVNLDDSHYLTGCRGIIKISNFTNQSDKVEDENRKKCISNKRETPVGKQCLKLFYHRP